jgi:hypothetical protein
LFDCRLAAEYGRKNGPHETRTRRRGEPYNTQRRLVEKAGKWWPTSKWWLKRERLKRDVAAENGVVAGRVVLLASREQWNIWNAFEE